MLLLIHTMEVERREKMRLSHEENADFQASITLGGVESARKDSERSECAFTSATALESLEGSEKGPFSSGRWSLMSDWSRRGLNATSCMFPKWTKAAIGAVKPCNLGDSEQGCGGRDTTSKKKKNVLRHQKAGALSLFRSVRKEGKKNYIIIIMFNLLLTGWIQRDLLPEYIISG